MTKKRRRILTGSVGLVLCVFMAFAQQPRFPQYKLEDTTPGPQRALAERMLKQTRAGLGGPWNMMLRSPGMAEGIFTLYNHFRFNTKLPQRLVEFGILITAREWNGQFEWFVHYPLAISQGVSAEVLADLRVNKRPAGMKPDEEAVYDFAIELLRKHFVSEPTFQRAKKILGEEQVVDVTALVGSYVTIAALLNVAEEKGTATEGPGFLPISK